MGSVYQAEDLRLPGRMWAIKEMVGDAHATPEDLAAAIKRFDDEIALMARLSNPRIPGVVDRFREGGHHYFAMDFIPGASLETRLDQANAPLPERQVLGWIIQVCDVLAYVHTQHPPIILRDLKPGNIMITPDDEVRVIDFGIARTYKRGQASNTENLGTMIYASPEHLGQSGQTDARSDVYSLGATLYHLLTNTEPIPMEAPAPGSLRRLNPAVSEATERVVLRAMQVDPAQRFQSAAEMAASLRACLASLGAGGALAGVPGTPPSGVPAAPRAGGAGGARAGGSGAAPRLARVHGGIVCPQCGHLNRTGARYCARDGFMLPGMSSVASAAGNAAARRGAPIGQMPPRSAGASPPIGVPHTAPVAAQSGAAPLARVGRGTGIPTLAGIGTAELNAVRGTEALVAGRYPQAARHLEMAITQGRATYDTHMLLGRTYRHLNRPGDAASQFERAGRLRPTAEAYFQVGLAEREAGHPAQAQVALTRARQLDPQDPLIAYQLGLACLEQGHLAQAEGELEAGLALQPEQAPILLALGRIRATRHQWEGAIEFFRRASAAAPDNAGAYLDLGRALLALRRLNEATRALEEAVRLAPDSAEAQTALGMCYHAQGKRRQARSALRQAVTLDPRDEEARRLLKQL